MLYLLTPINSKERIWTCCIVPYLAYSYDYHYHYLYDCSKYDYRYSPTYWTPPRPLRLPPPLDSPQRSDHQTTPFTSPVIGALLTWVRWRSGDQPLRTTPVFGGIFQLRVPWAHLKITRITMMSHWFCPQKISSCKGGPVPPQKCCYPFLVWNALGKMQRLMWLAWGGSKSCGLLAARPLASHHDKS